MIQLCRLNCRNVCAISCRRNLPCFTCRLIQYGGILREKTVWNYAISETEYVSVLMMAQSAGRVPPLVS